MIVAALAPTGGIYLAAIPMISMWSISGAVVQAMMSQRVSERAQGKLQGAISSLRSLAVLVGPALSLSVFLSSSMRGAAPIFRVRLGIWRARCFLWRACFPPGSGKGRPSAPLSSIVGSQEVIS
jgi:hypothetical protein